MSYLCYLCDQRHDTTTCPAIQYTAMPPIQAENTTGGQMSANGLSYGEYLIIDKLNAIIQLLKNESI